MDLTIAARHAGAAVAAHPRCYAPVVVEGRPNWSMVLFVLAFADFLWNVDGLMVLLFLGAMLAALYSVQARRYDAVANHVSAG